MNFTFEQMAVSTAEDERNYFSGSMQLSPPPPAGNSMPSGTYRVVDGSLYLVLPSALLTREHPAVLPEQNQADR